MYKMAKLSTLLVVLLVCVISTNAWWLSEPTVEPHQEITDDCLNYAAWGRCEFYECLERRFPCGHRGYATYVGLHFCRKIFNKLDDFTPKGTLWLNRTSVCLTKSLLPLYQSYASRCGDVRDVGAEGILDCNNRVDPDGQDFCSFVHDNVDEYQSIFGFEEITRMLRMRNQGVVARLLLDGASCGADMLRGRFYSVTGAMNDLIGSLVENWEGLVDRWNELWN